MKSNLRLINYFLFLSLFILPLEGRADVKKEIEKMTSIEKPFELRDPFQAPFVKAEKKEETIVGKVETGVYNNIPKIGKVELSKVRVIGVLVGKNRSAMVRVEGLPDTYVVKEGDILGENNAVLRAIVPGGLILVEKIINVYGEEEFLETVIPISK